MDSEHTPQFNYTPEDRLAIQRTPMPSWVSNGTSQHPQPVPHKTVHVEGEITVRAGRALMRGIRHQLSRRADITLTHELKRGYVKTTIR